MMAPEASYFIEAQPVYEILICNYRVWHPQPIFAYAVTLSQRDQIWWTMANKPQSVVFDFLPTPLYYGIEVFFLSYHCMPVAGHF